LLEWLDPPFSCGHWNPELVHLAGGAEVLGQEGRPSRTLSWREAAAASPDVVVIACCGFDLERTMVDVAALDHVPEWRALPAVRKGRVSVIDGSQYFSRPGPRLVDSLELLAHAIDPMVHPLPAWCDATSTALFSASAPMASCAGGLE
jgi:iron complex transport system substrate-binding protein